MKVVVCTLPLRLHPTDFPPLGALPVIQAMRAAGYEASLYDIDALRPTFEQVMEHLRREAPDVLGISAVVSTAYAATERLAHAVRSAMPRTKLILGGNLAASAEILHRYCGIDVCVIGEGEKAGVELLRYYENHRDRDDFAELARIKGITFLDAGGAMVFTDYNPSIPAAELFEPDFSILEQQSKIDTFITDPLGTPDFVLDPRSYEPRHAGKKLGVVVTAKGCVARCTFCHRWDKGYRQIPAEKVIKKIKYLMDRYDVGFIQMGDENFGSDKKETEKLVAMVKELGILWRAHGVRARTVNREMLDRWRDAGCVSVCYGFETGSPSMLKVMEKNLELDHNLSAARWTFEAGLWTCYQLVLAMPGETHATIGETIQMIKQITEFMPEPPDKRLSINYIQALPGTTVYEYARAKGLIGPKLEDERDYLLRISDTNASDDTKFLNFTEYPYLTVRTWRKRIAYEAIAHWHRFRRKRARIPGNESFRGRACKRDGYFNLHLMRHPRLVAAICTFPLLQWVVIWLLTFKSELMMNGWRVFLGRVRELVEWNVAQVLEKSPPRRSPRSGCGPRSLRQTMKDLDSKPVTPAEESMAPLRLGR